MTFAPRDAARRARALDPEGLLLERPARRPARPPARQRRRRADRLPRPRRPRRRLPLQPRPRHRRQRRRQRGRPARSDLGRGRRRAARRLLVPGSALALTYLVTNPGTTALQVLSITDDNATPADGRRLPPDSTSPATPTATSCSTPARRGSTPRSASPVPRRRRSRATTSTSSPCRATTRSRAASSRRPTRPTTPRSPTLVSIRKDLNAVNLLSPSLTEQADTMATAPRLAAGAPVRWTYRLTTSSLTPVSVVSVIDDNGTPGDASDDWAALALTTTFAGSTFNVGDTNYDGLLGAGETWLYTSAGVAAAPTTGAGGLVHQHRPPHGPGRRAASSTATATRPSTSARPASTSSRPSTPPTRCGPPLPRTPTPPGPTVAVGSTVRFTYVVANTSAGPMTVTELVDDNATPGDAADDVRLGAAIVPMLGTDGCTTWATPTSTACSTPASAGSTRGASVVGTVGGFTNVGDGDRHQRRRPRRDRHRPRELRRPPAAGSTSRRPSTPPCRSARPGPRTPTPRPARCSPWGRARSSPTWCATPATCRSRSRPSPTATASPRVP